MTSDSGHVVDFMLTGDNTDDGKPLQMKGGLTLGQAAEWAGYSKETFMELLADYNVSLTHYPADELDEDIENARCHSI